MNGGERLRGFYISGTRKETTFYHCRLILETETEPGTKSRFHYLCCTVLQSGGFPPALPGPQ